ncbi:MAG: SufD family Fe-S cluster assembly protein [Microgenomates group bacterium]
MKIINLNYEGRDLKKTLVVKAGEVVNLTTVSNYIKPHQTGIVEVKAVVMANGFLNLKGIIKIEKGAELCEGFLSQKVLLVGKNARAVAVPELEIECNEVRASHAASVGRIDEEQLFYLMSRGLARPEAVKLIIKAFLS